MNLKQRDQTQPKVCCGGHAAGILNYDIDFYFPPYIKNPQKAH